MQARRQVGPARGRLGHYRARAENGKYGHSPLGLADGRYWARTSDPLLVRLCRRERRLTTRDDASRLQTRFVRAQRDRTPIGSRTAATTFGPLSGQSSLARRGRPDRSARLVALRQQGLCFVRIVCGGDPDLKITGTPVDGR